MDSPRHTKLRGIISSAFTPRQVARIEEGIRRDAHTIVSEAAPTGGGNFVSLIAKRLPLMTISDMIGVPEADRERIVEASDVIVIRGRSESFTSGRELMEVLGKAMFTLHQFAAELAAHREDNPGDDLMSALVHTEVDGERLTRDEISAFFVLLSVAGNDTTRHTTSHAMRALTENPDQAAWLREDLDGRLPTAVEEFIRWATPVIHSAAPRPARSSSTARWPGGREGDPVLPVGQPRRDRVRRPHEVRRHHANPTTTSGSGAAVLTSVSGRRWREPSSGPSSARCIRRSPTSRSGSWSASTAAGSSTR